MNPALRTSHLPSMRVLVILVVAGLMGCADNPPPNYPSIAPFDQTKLSLGPGDKLELTIFYGTKESKAAYSLDASGQMQVQFIGSVDAAGKTTKQLQEEIKARLADGYLNDPVVLLTLVEINSLKCTVTGQVIRNGSVKFTPGMTIVEAVASAGGFSPLARKNLVKVTRKLEGKQEIYKIPVEMIQEGQRPNFQLMPGDEVYVPERAW
jgi:protein involved in polysaccharide export with SLBB domain